MEHEVRYSKRFHSCLKSLLKGSPVLLGLLIAAGAGAQTDLSSQYLWQPVRIGGGGWVVGMTIHPLDPTVRYARTDVGSPYRWNNTTQQWIPMRVSNANGTGIRFSTGDRCAGFLWRG